MGGTSAVHSELDFVGFFFSFFLTVVIWSDDLSRFDDSRFSWTLWLFSPGLRLDPDTRDVLVQTYRVSRGPWLLVMIT